MAKTIGQLTQATTLASGDEFVIEQSGLTKRVAASVVRGGLVNADIDAAAAIAHSKLANITAGRVLLGNASNVPTATALTGDVTVSNTGVTAIGSAKVTPTMLTQPLTLATAKAFNWNGSSSNTFLDFESIPSWVRKITIVFHTLSLSGTADFLVRLGSGSVATSGYSSSWAAVSGGVGDNGSSTAGLIIRSGAASVGLSGIMSVVSTNTGTIWASSHTVRGTNSAVFFGGGEIMLAGALDRVRITSSNGSDTFDAGSVNIMYEG